MTPEFMWDFQLPCLMGEDVFYGQPTKKIKTLHDIFGSANNWLYPVRDL